MGEDFTEKSRRTIADRAGHLCSICIQPTTCSDEEGKPFRIADAAHIVGASSEGPRGDDPIAHDKASPENGIWLCARCHRIIDGDPKRHSSGELRAYKEEAEERARRLVHGESICQIMESTQRTIVTFFRRYAPWNLPELQRDEYLLGVQAIPIGTRVDCAREEFEYRRTRKRVSDEQIVLCVSLPGRSEIAISNHSFDPGAQSRSLGGFLRIKKALSELN